VTAPSTPMPRAASAPVSEAVPVADNTALQGILESLGQLGEDGSVPRNVRRGAVSARDELLKQRVARDVRIASAVYVLDELANDPNIPTHGRTAIWSIISSLESVQ
jgi:uncharacterized protein